MEELSDRGSTPLRSTKKVPCLRHFLLYDNKFYGRGLLGFPFFYYIFQHVDEIMNRVQLYIALENTVFKIDGQRFKFIPNLWSYIRRH